MIKVYSVYWGDKYAPEYVQILQRMVKKHLAVPHEFICITDSQENWDGVKKVDPIVDWHGWWQKLSLFGIADGPSLYFDLDVVICGGIDYLAEQAPQCKLAAPPNWAQSGHGGIQSSVMAWDGTWRQPFELFDYPRQHTAYWGDQEFLTALVGMTGYTKLNGVCSYKYHCRGKGGIPDGARVVAFHGKPDPHEVREDWLQVHRSV